MLIRREPASPSDAKDRIIYILVIENDIGCSGGITGLLIEVKSRPIAFCIDLHGNLLAEAVTVAPQTSCIREASRRLYEDHDVPKIPQLRSLKEGPVDDQHCINRRQRGRLRDRHITLEIEGRRPVEAIATGRQRLQQQGSDGGQIAGIIVVAESGEPSARIALSLDRKSVV